MKSKQFAISFVLVAALAVAFIVRWSETGDPAVAPHPPAAQGHELHRNAELEATAATRSGGADAEPPDAPSSPARATIAPAAQLGRLRVRVLTVDGVPLAGVRLRLEQPNADHDGEDVPRRARATTDSAGFAMLEAPAGPELLLVADTDAHGCLDAEADVPPLVAQELRELELRVERKPHLAFFARVIARESGEPMAGAHVALHSAHGSEPLDELELAPACWRTAASADASGFVELRVDPTEPLVASFSAAGRVRAYAECGGGHETRELAFVVSLMREAALRVRASEAGSGPLVGIEVRAWTEGLYLQESEPLPNDELFGGVVLPDLQWRAATDAAGAAELRGLPSLAPLRVELVRAGEVIHREPDPLLLEEGEVREVEIALGSGARIVGRVVEQDGRPVRDLRIWRQKARRQGLWYFDADDPVTSEATSDAEGRFVFEDVPPGDWWIGAAALPRSESAADANSIAAVPDRVAVPRGAVEVLVELVVHRGLYVHGIALDPAGDPVHRVMIWPADMELMNSLATGSGPDGRFALGPLVPGDYELFVQGSIAGFASQGPIRARAGEELVLRMERAAEIRGRVLCADGNGCAAELTLEGIGKNQSWQLGQGVPAAKKDGSFAEDGISPGPYVLWGERPDGQVGYVERLELAAGATIEGVMLPLERAGTLSVALDGEGDYAKLCLLREGRLLKRFYAWPSKPTPTRVPSGTYTIELRDEGERVLSSQSVQVVADETRAVVIHDARGK